MKNFIALVTILCCLGSIHAACTQADIGACTGTNYNDPSSISTICPNLNTINTCVANLGCQSTDNAYIQNWQGQSNAMYYMCNDGRALLSSVASCINSQNAQASFPSCKQQQNNTYTANINSDPNNAYCKGVNAYVQCMDSVVSGTCQNKPAGDAYGILLQRAMAPTASQTNNCVLQQIPDTYPQGPSLSASGTNQPTGPTGGSNPTQSTTPSGNTNPPQFSTPTGNANYPTVTYYPASAALRSYSAVLVGAGLITAVAFLSIFRGE